MLFLAVAASATHVAVLETVADEKAKDKVTFSDRQFLTNVLREQAVKELPAVQNYTIMTRENISAMLPPGKAIEDCEGSCLAETGRNIAADFICQARVGFFGTSLTLSAELYETAGNKLIASFNGRGDDVEGLLKLIEDKSPEFFRAVKGGIAFTGIGGFGILEGGGDFDYEVKKKYIVEIVSNPAGSVPTIDGRAEPKCLSTPCKVLVEEGDHRFVVSKERYVAAEQVVFVKTNNQRIDFTLQPNYGWLEVDPVLAGAVSKRGEVKVVIDGVDMIGKKFQLESGVHDVLVTHPCYDPVTFKVSIARKKTEVFGKEMVRGLGGLDLNAEYQGVPQEVPVYVDGIEMGNTPFTRKIPLCADVFIKGKGWSEKVDANPEWHKVVHMTHQLQHDPMAVIAVEKVEHVEVPAPEKVDDESQWEEFVSASEMNNVERTGINVIGVVMSAVVFTAGTVLAVVGNSIAKNASEKEYETEEKYEEYLADARSGQTLRNVGIGVAILGGIGVAFNIAF